MILTGPAIRSAVQSGQVVLEPFDETDLNPNSYNFHLAEAILVPGEGQRWRKVKLSHDGYLLLPHKVYLGTTLEHIGSNHFVTLLLGRSSLGRLGLFLNITADLGHLGSSSRWTLELMVVQPLRIYPNMKIGQVSFWLTDPTSPDRYHGRYHNDTGPSPNRDRRMTRRPT
jgi:dCTP deaminase